jgi:aminoglycoside/choline kinase family phosphotransferase
MASMGTIRSNGLPPPKPTDVAQAIGVDAISIDWLAGDGSDRCYYRLTSPEMDQSLVLMQLSGSDAQALRDNGYDWIKVADILTGHGIPVPRVIAPMPEHAALVIEDYGDIMLEGKVFELAEKNQHEPLRELYRKASGIAARFLGIEPSAEAVWCRRSFDADRFVWELNFFLQKYAAPVAGIRLTEPEMQVFQDESRRLSQTLASNSKYFVHRDFHSRNVMVKDGRLAIIDFQDARLGPAAYDVVSLCFDSYVPFKGAQRREMLDDALELIRSMRGARLAAEVEESWRPMLLQRQLKAIGSFGFLTNDKQRGNYLRYVGPALTTLEEQNVGDDRWPFLSRELLKRLRAHLGKAATR